MFSHPILITGGAGYLGSHMVALCLEKKINVVVVDNLINSDLSNLKKLENHFNTKIPFLKIDLRDLKKLKQLFNVYHFSAVIHFAGLKSVSESLKNPELYFENNVNGSKNLIHCIKLKGISNVIFSSSATVYGEPLYLPIDESHPVKPTNPYGETKAIIENLFLDDQYFNRASVKILRYFNPVGSYEGIIGEKPSGIPNNLMPYILGVANGNFEYLKIYGDDYDTKDGTGVRDYIHVMDLIKAHFFALKNNSFGCNIFNVGCGTGVSVKEILKIFQDVNSITIPFKILPRRDGDVASCYASVNKIRKELQWISTYNLKEICTDSWKVYSKSSL